jgi:chorismate mutase
MRLFLAVIGVCLVMWGCDKKAKDQTQGMADVEIWKGLYAREKADKEKLQSSFDAERAANANLEKKLQPVQDQADRLKIQLLTERTAAAREIARLKSELGGAKSAAIALADLAESGTSAKSPVNGKPAPASATDIANAEKAIADLEDRLAELQGRAGEKQGR